MVVKRRVLHLTYNMGVGGTEQVISQLVSNIDNTQYDNSIGCIDGEIGLLGESLQKQGVEFLVFNRQPGFDFNLIKAIRSAVKTGEFDVVHCHQYTPFVYGLFAAFLLPAKVVFTEHGRFHPDSFSWKRRLVNPLLGWSASAIVAISKATAGALIDYEWFSSRSIQVVYNGLHPASIQDSIHQRDVLGISHDEVVFGTIARFDSIKNLPMMVRAFHELSLVNPKVRLLLVGDGDERQQLETLVSNHGLEKKVIFSGYQKNTALFMSVIDVYLLTSYSEGTSMTLLEAMSMGACSIVTRVGGNVEIVEHLVSGIVVESEDDADLVHWMNRLAVSPQQRKELGGEGRRVFENKFSIENMVRQYSNIYKKILGS